LALSFGVIFLRHAVPVKPDKLHVGGLGEWQQFRRVGAHEKLSRRFKQVHAELALEARTQRDGGLV
jgi:hypothetical protein